MITDVLEQAEYVRRSLTTFSPRGRLHAVERAISAATSASPSNNLCIALKCQEGWLVVSTVPSSPHFYDDDEDPTITVEDHQANDENEQQLPLLIHPPEHSRMMEAPFARVSSSTVVATGGNIIDSQILVNVIHRLAVNLEESEDGGLRMGTTTTKQTLAPSNANNSNNNNLRQQQQQQSLSTLARQIADHLQQPTQSLAKGPILACSVLLLLVGGPTTLSTSCCWRVDPSGQFYRSSRAAVVGYEATKAEQILIKKLDMRNKKKKGTTSTSLLTLVQAKKLIRECIEEVMSSSSSTGNSNDEKKKISSSPSAPTKLKLCGLLLSATSGSSSTRSATTAPLLVLSDSDLAP